MELQQRDNKVRFSLALRPFSHGLELTSPYWMMIRKRDKRMSRRRKRRRKMMRRRMKRKCKALMMKVRFFTCPKTFLLFFKYFVCFFYRLALTSFSSSTIFNSKYSIFSAEVMST